MSETNGNTGPKPLPSWAQAVSYVGIPGLVVFFLHPALQS